MDEKCSRNFKDRLRAADGYFDLGMYLDANEELEAIEPELRDATPVLVLRLGIYSVLKRWELAQAVAMTLWAREGYKPGWLIAWATATRRVENLAAAKAILLEGLEKFPEVATIHFNLACYECQLGNPLEANARLRQAIALDGSLREAAISNPDLEPLWAVI